MTGLGGRNHAAWPFWGPQHSPHRCNRAPTAPRYRKWLEMPQIRSPPTSPTPNRAILVNRGFGARRGYLPPSRMKPFGGFCLNFFCSPLARSYTYSLFGGKKPKFNHPAAVYGENLKIQLLHTPPHAPAWLRPPPLLSILRGWGFLYVIFS